MRFKMVALFVAAATACAPGPYGSIPVDPVGLRERWRRACELGKVEALDDTCTEREGGPSETNGPSDSNGSDERDDAEVVAQPDPADAATNDGSFSPSPTGQSSYGSDGG